MPIQYDGGSLAPHFDLGQAIQIVLAGAEKKEQQQKEAEAAGLGDQLDVAGADPLHNPENLRIVQRMARLDPQAAQFGVSVLKLRSEGEIQAAQKEAADASKFYQAFLDSKDPAERTRFLTQTIREREEAGKDSTKLRELIGLSGDKQTLQARRQVILAGDAATLADQSLSALRNALEVQGLQLKNLQTQQEMESGKDSDVAGMRKEFTNLSDPFIKVRDAYARVRQSAQKPSPAGDLSLIFNYMKMLDPSSTVRESEFEAAAAAGSFGDRIKAAVGRVQSGTKLEAAQRADFVQRSAELYKSQQSSHRQLRDQYSSLAASRKFRPEDVVVDFNMPELDEPLAAAKDESGVKQIGKFTVRVVE